MLLHDLVSTSARVAAVHARSEKVAQLAALFSRLAPAEIDPAVAWLSGELTQGRIGLGWAAVRDAGEGNAPAAEPSLAIGEVDAAFSAIASTTGSGSAAARARLLAGLFGRATDEEQGFLSRLLVGELRQGALSGIAVEALARAAEAPASEVRRALMLAGDLRAVARALLTEGRPGLARFALRLFQPVQPMLASPAEDVEDALGRLGEAALEWKLDGARVQVHREGDEVRVWSRRLNDVTAAVPELVEAVRALPAERLILDGEVIALRADGSPLPFQVTMRRFGRKLDVAALRSELPLSPFFFDLLHLDGEDLIDRPAAERFAALAERAPAGAVIPRMVTGDPVEAEAFLEHGAGARPRGAHGQGDRCPLRGGKPGLLLAQGEKPAHTRPRHPRRRVGARATARVALEPPPRRPRRGLRRLRHARQDVQGA